MRPLRLLRAMLFFAIFGAASSASALTIEGTIRYWDNRTGGSTASGSLFSWGQGDRNLPYPHVEIWDYNGSCHDFNDAGCTETDDYKLTTVVANSSGRYEWSGLGVNC